MTEKRLTKRMKALNNLAYYSKRIQLTIDAELVEKEIGVDFGEITDEIHESIECLLKDGRNNTIITCDNTNTVIDIMVKEND